MAYNYRQSVMYTSAQEMFYSNNPKSYITKNIFPAYFRNRLMIVLFKSTSIFFRVQMERFVFGK